MRELYTFKVQEKEIFIKLPGSEDRSIMEIVYAAELSKALKRGVMSHADIRRTILDDGGLKYSKEDKERIKKLVNDISKSENKYHKLVLEKKDTTQIVAKITELSTQLAEIEADVVKIFNNSAESIANNQLLLWATANLTFWNEDKTRVFAGSDEEERLKSYFQALDDETLDAKIGERAFFVLRNYLTAGTKNKEDFDKIVEFLDALEQLPEAPTDVPRNL